MLGGHVEREEMNQKTIAFTVVMFCVLALPLTVWADSQTYTPPAQKGTIYVIVRFTKGLGVLPQDTNVSVRWGNWSKSGRLNPGGGRTGKYGFVISLRHSKNDSVPITVNTDGRIVNIYQGNPPSEWSDGNWHKASW